MARLTAAAVLLGASAFAASDEAAIQALVARLRDVNGAVRGMAAAELRQIYAKEPAAARVEAVVVAVPDNFTGTWITYYTNGQKLKEAGYAAGRLGLLKTYHDNGKPQSEAAYDPDGKIDGVQRNWWRDGTLMYEAHYVHGVHHGREVYWNDAGALETERIWEDGVQVSGK